MQRRFGNPVEFLWAVHIVTRAPESIGTDAHKAHSCEWTKSTVRNGTKYAPAGNERGKFLLAWQY